MKMGDEPQFVEKVSDDLMCPICLTLLQEPQQTNCGHEFCRECVRPLMRGGTLTCPICRARSLPNQIFDDKRLKREIMDLKINCDQSGKGCKWGGELRQREQHNDQCGYVSKPCVNECGQVVMSKDMGNHKTKDCRLRIAACEHCGARIKYELLRPHHLLECRKYPVHCTYKCGMVVAREGMKEHTSLQGTCPNSPLHCEFHEVGCKFTGKRQHLNKHIETSATGHIHLVLAEMRGIKRKLADVEKELSEESEQRKLVMPTGQFVYIWKIDKWQQKVDNAKEERLLESNAFYIDPGYHMFIKAYPCSLHTSSDLGGNELGLFLSPTTGDFDAHVDWPFCKSFTLSVVDQQLGGQDISISTSPHSQDQRNLYCASPTSSGLGWKSFGTHEKLKTRCYIKDDAVLIKLSVKL